MIIRKTKIVATIGPSSCGLEKITQLINAGVDVFRLNFSHGNEAWHIEQARLIREISLEKKISLGIICDLQGPKIRIGAFEKGQATLAVGQSFTLNVDCLLGGEYEVGVDYPNLPYEVRDDDVLLLDDGRISLKVTQVVRNEIHCIVLSGGLISNNKGINKQGGGLSAAALTKKDFKDIKTAVQLGADFIAVSFPSKRSDIDLARESVFKEGGTAQIIAKIERAEAIKELDSIIDASDAVMVARGDLGVEVGVASVPGLQKMIIRRARQKNKVVITATQMMESMINSPVPTRAEVSDVANAVLDGTDAVMLSAETATGKYPLEAVQAMHNVCVEAEHEQSLQSNHSIDIRKFKKIDESMAMAAIYISDHLPIKAIAALTKSGATALWVSRSNVSVPIYALSTDPLTRRRLKLYRGVYPFILNEDSLDINKILSFVESSLIDHKVVTVGDLILVTFGDIIGKVGSTNTIKALLVGNITD